mgnify:CR=1 FL=1
MTERPSKRTRREAARRTRQRRKRLLWAGVAAAILVSVGAIVIISGGSGNEVAALAPDFELDTIEGDTVRLSDYRGQPVAVTFMHTY